MKVISFWRKGEGVEPPDPQIGDRQVLKTCRATGPYPLPFLILIELKGVLKEKERKEIKKNNRHFIGQLYSNPPALIGYPFGSPPFGP